MRSSTFNNSSRMETQPNHPDVFVMESENSKSSGFKSQNTVNS